VDHSAYEQLQALHVLELDRLKPIKLAPSTPTEGGDRCRLLLTVYGAEEVRSALGHRTNCCKSSGLNFDAFNNCPSLCIIFTMH
jgi:hypothetical protein